MAYVRVLLALAVLSPAWLCAQDEGAAVLERRVKAALLYRFINYVDWPESAFPQPDSPFTIGVVGADALATELTDFAAGRKVLNRRLAVRRIRATDELKNIQLLFVGRADAAQLAGIARAAHPNALIVTESDNALKQGAVINFVIADGQVRFEVSLESARRRNLRLSSRLLSVAHSVQGATP